MQPETSKSPLPFLGSLARSSRPEDRALWLRVASDYFLRADAGDAAVSEDFAENFEVCWAGSDEADRLALAHRLIERSKFPPRLALTVLDFGGPAAEAILAHAPGLPRSRLLAACEDPRLVLAVARRSDLDPELVASILDNETEDAAALLIANPRAPLEGDSYSRLVAIAKACSARGDYGLAERLLARPRLTLEAAPLFLEASSSQRRSLLMAAQRAELGRPRAAPAASAPRGSFDALEEAAMSGEIEEFSAILGEWLGCDATMAKRIVADRSGEPLALALSALGAPNDVAVRVLTAADFSEGAEYRRVGALARLQDALTPLAARRVLDAILEGSRLTPAETAPVVRPSVPAGTERRAREPAPFIREEALPPAVRRRRRAFAYLAANGGLSD